MAKSKSKLVSAVKTFRQIAPKTRAKRPIARAPRANPGPQGELMATLTPVLPAVASYAGARLIGRILRLVVGARIAQGRYAKHFGPLGNAAAFGAAYFAGKKVARARPYQTEMLIGAGIALVQSLLETYLPGMAHFIDAGAPQAPANAQAAATSQRAAKRAMAGTRYVLPGEVESARASARVAEAQAQNFPSEAQHVDDEVDEAMGAADDGEGMEGLEDLYDGVFAQ